MGELSIFDSGEFGAANEAALAVLALMTKLAKYLSVDEDVWRLVFWVGEVGVVVFLVVGFCLGQGFGITQS